MNMTDLMRCQFCGERVNPQTGYQAIRGWELMREPGGLDWTQVPHWACDSCIDGFRRAEADARAAGTQLTDEWCRVAGLSFRAA